MTITHRELRSLPTVLSLWETGGGASIDGADEVDIVFFAPPTADALTCRVRTSHDQESGRVDRTVGYLDTVGRLVAEVFLSEPAPAAGTHGETVSRAEELLLSAVEQFEVADVRRVRMRIFEHIVSSAPPVWSATVLQHYRTDHEPVEDIAIVCTDPSGSVVARAWVTVAVHS